MPPARPGRRAALVAVGGMALALSMAAGWTAVGLVGEQVGSGSGTVLTQHAVRAELALRSTPPSPLASDPVTRPTVAASTVPPAPATRPAPSASSSSIHPSPARSSARPSPGQPAPARPARPARPAPARPSLAQPSPTQPSPGPRTSRVLALVGGQVGAACSGNALTFRFATPSDGWRVEVGEQTADDIEIHLTSATSGVEVSIACRQGVPTVVGEQRSDLSDD